MKVILMENVETLGPAGSIKEVANGYARNYLLPRGIAVPATADALKRLERQRTSIERRAAQAAEAAQGMANRLAATTVYIYSKSGEQNRLYGSVTTADIATALNEQHNLELDRRNITLTEPIHRLGTYTANVKLTGGTVGKLNVVVDTEANRGKHLLVAAAPEATVEAATADAEANIEANTEAPVAEAATEVQNTVADTTESSVAELAATPAEADAPVAEAQAEAEEQTGLGVDETR